MCLTIAFQIFEGVLELDAVRLKKTVHFHTSLKSQQAAELRGRELPFAIGLQGNRFEGSAREVLARRG